MKQRRPVILAIVLLILWLLLSGTLAPGPVLLGAVLSLAIVVGIRRMRPLQPRVRRLHLAVRLLFTVLADIVRSNVGVARVVLGLVRDRDVKSGFMGVALDLRDPHGLAFLAVILTVLPGTVWVELSPDNRLTLHVLDLVDEDLWIRTIKRYEQPLMGIFE